MMAPRDAQKDVPYDEFRKLEEYKPLLALPTSQLLAKFGSGKHKPGSGSAAAFSGMLSCKLALTVIKLTKAHEAYSNIFPQLDFLEASITQNIEPELIELFYRDSEAFDEVYIARLARDAAPDEKEKKRLRQIALDKLRLATEIPLQIAQSCIQLSERSLAIFDLGYKSARGDSGVAISNALSGANGAIFISYLNLTQFRDGEWAQATRRRTDALLHQVQELQDQMFSRVVSLQEQGERSLQLPLL